MGTQSVRWAVRVGGDLALAPTARSILAYLAHCRNERTNRCDPSRETIVRDTGWDDRTVRRALKALIASGVITAPKDGPNYTLHMDRESKSLDRESKESDTESGTNGQKVQTLDRESKSLDRESKPSYIGKEHQLEHQENTPKPPSAVVVVVPDRFDEFYALWPKKVGRPIAEKAWAKAVKRATPDTVIGGARAYAENPHRPERQFIPNPATWLNRDGWNDELPGPRSSGRPTPTQRVAAIAEAGARLEQRRGLASITSLTPKGPNP